MSAIPLSPGIEKITETSIEISYDQLPESNRVRSYKIECIHAATDKLVARRTIAHVKYDRQPRKKVTFKDLIPGTEYKFRIAAVNPVGQSGWSQEEKYKTDGTAPGELTNLKSIIVLILFPILSFSRLVNH